LLKSSPKYSEKEKRDLLNKYLRQLANDRKKNILKGYQNKQATNLNELYQSFELFPLATWEYLIKSHFAEKLVKLKDLYLNKILQCMHLIV